MAYGEMMLSEKQYMDSSPRYLMVRLIGMRKAQNEILEYHNKEDWHRARMIAFYAGNGGNFKRLRSFKHVMTFPWEKEGPSELPEYEDVKKVFPKKYFA